MANPIIKIDGITYFKLQSEYEGDKTKNCGLLGNEIDGNFYFLRGNDVNAVSIDGDGNLVIAKVNGEQLKVNIGQELGQPTFTFDKENGELIVTYPDGSSTALDGFLVEGKDVKVASDATIVGNGSLTNPLGISPVERTGAYSPVQAYIDLTANEALPDVTSLGKGYRLVTKETISNFGLLYTYSDIKAIQNKLEETGSLWHVPTQKDWSELLNAAERCDDDRTHETTEINVWTGKHAGARAKSVELWNASDKEESGYSVAGEDSLPTEGQMGTFKVFPVGLGEGSRGALSKDSDEEGKNYDVEGFGLLAGFWSSTEVPNNSNDGEPNIYTRTFSYDSRRVLQESSKPLSRLSLRLVKDFDIENNEAENYENILGYEVPCVLITNEETNYSKVWTSANIGFKGFNGVVSDEWSAATAVSEVKDAYFINEWNGEKWAKKQMTPGDTVVIIDYDGQKNKYIECMLVQDNNGMLSLVDTTEVIKKQLGDDIDKINEAIISLSGAVESISGTAYEVKEGFQSVVETVNNLSGITFEAETNVNNVVNEIKQLSAATITETEHLTGKDISVPEGGYKFKANQENAFTRENGEAIPFSIDFNFGTR